MRILVMFDMPTFTLQDKKEYRLFRKYLISHGYLMMQRSIYIKLVLNQTNAAAAMKGLEKHKPNIGIVQVLTITEKQFSRMELLVGSVTSEVVDTTERMIIL